MSVVWFFLLYCFIYYFTIKYLVNKCLYVWYNWLKLAFIITWQERIWGWLPLSAKTESETKLICQYTALQKTMDGGVNQWS